MTLADLLAEPAHVVQAKAEFLEMQQLGRVAGWEAWREAGRAYAPLEAAAQG